MKSRFSYWLFVSLIPVGLLACICLVVLSAAPTDPDTGTLAGGWSALAALMVLFWAYCLLALTAGIVLKLLEWLETGRDQREGQRYAELHDWHPISKSSWRASRNGNATLSVSQVLQGRTYVLTIKAGQESVSTGGFSCSLFALQFGDWIADTMSEDARPIDADVVEEKRQEWEERGLAVRSQRTPVVRN